MPQGNPRPGEVYCHFKQKKYQIVTIARHSETGEKLVIYQALYDDFQVYARPFDMFVSLVDKQKYPQAGQKYRFQLIEGSVSEKPDEETSAKIQEKQKLSTAQDRKEAATPEEKMMAFFDADTVEGKYKILSTMEACITNHMINNMAVVLDLVIADGPVEKRFEELKRCVRTMQKYESTRLR